MRSLQPGKSAARRAWRKAQYEVVLSLLWEGRREQALAHVQRLHPTTGDVPAAYEEAIHYLETQREWIGDY